MGPISSGGSITNGVRRVIGMALAAGGGVTIFNSAEVLMGATYWLGASLLLVGVLMFSMGFRMVRRSFPDHERSNPANEEFQRQRVERMEERARKRREARKSRRNKDLGDS